MIKQELEALKNKGQLRSIPNIEAKSDGRIIPRPRRGGTTARRFSAVEETAQNGILFPFLQMESKTSLSY